MGTEHKVRTKMSDNVWLKHKYITTNLSITAADHIVVNAAKGLAETLKTNKPSHLSNQSNEALSKLAKIFNEAAAGQYSDREARDQGWPPIDLQQLQGWQGSPLID